MQTTNETAPFNPEESLQLINSMINTTKNKLADDGFLLIFWGWLVSISALIHFVSIQLHSEYGALVWPILMPLGGIFSGIYGARQSKKARVKTYIGSYLGYVWMAFGLAMFITLIMLPFHGIQATYSFGCAIASVFFGEAAQLLWLALALIGSYVIPGHMLRAKFKSEAHAGRA
jgi:hypothetical protein